MKRPFTWDNHESMTLPHGKRYPWRKLGPNGIYVCRSTPMWVNYFEQSALVRGLYAMIRPFSDPITVYSLDWPMYPTFCFSEFSSPDVVSFLGFLDFPSLVSKGIDFATGCVFSFFPGVEQNIGIIARPKPATLGNKSQSAATSQSPDKSEKESMKY